MASSEESRGDAADDKVWGESLGVLTLNPSSSVVSMGWSHETAGWLTEPRGPDSGVMLF
jgi:hypothetical protein